MGSFPSLPPPPWEQAGFPPLSRIASYFLSLPFMLFQALRQGAAISPAAPSSIPALPTASYSNEESWEVQRNEAGRIVGITIHRDAREQ